MHGKVSNEHVRVCAIVIGFIVDGGGGDNDDVAVPIVTIQTHHPNNFLGLYK